MFDFHPGPFALRTRPDVIESEASFRRSLDYTWISGCLFNLNVERNGLLIA